MIPPDLASFLQSGVSILVASRDERLLPDCLRGMGARVEEGGRELTVFLPEATAAVTLDNLAANGRIAVCFSRPSDHRSLQVKGRVIALGEADQADRAQVQRYRQLLAAELSPVGIPPRLSLRMAHEPCRSVRLRVESIYVQTPGPGAGAPLAGGGS